MRAACVWQTWDVAGYIIGVLVRTDGRWVMAVNYLLVVVSFMSSNYLNPVSFNLGGC